ncbi:hypothetical protein RSW78_26180, partial [Escherichia coli]|uniref:hypothetical protein n=1 Tax=Escherichia coli TaxID=562 RepID=UPI0028DEF1FD
PHLAVPHEGGPARPSDDRRGDRNGRAPAGPGPSPANPAAGPAGGPGPPSFLAALLQALSAWPT